MSTQSTPHARACVYKIMPYISGRSELQNNHKENIWQPNANENPYGCSQNVIRECQKANKSLLSCYPDGKATDLRYAIAEQHNIDCNKVICGNGSDELISLIASAYIDKGDEAIYSQYGFLMYRSAILAAGGVPVVVTEKKFQTDCQSICKAVNKKTKMIMLANPNNPTGTYINSDDLQNLLEAIPAHIVVLLDNAYAEYVTADDYNDGLQLTDKYPNLFVTRTFSKIYGLAALRLGWGYAADAIIETLNRLRSPFNVSAIAQLCGRVALEDQDFIIESRQKNTLWRKKICEKIKKMNIKKIDIDTSESQTNFLLLRFNDRNEVQQVQNYLKSKNLFLRNMQAYGLPNAIRYTIGDNETNEMVLKSLQEFIQLKDKRKI